MMFENEPFCPVCRSQEREHRRELNEVLRARRGVYAFESAFEREGGRRLVADVLTDPATATLSRHALVARCPARRAVYKLLGIYLPELEARLALNEIHKYKWLQAEKAGKDIWLETWPQNPMAAAASEWARQYWHEFVRWVSSSKVEPGYT
ncbi:MAG: hypothetical protein N2Z21_02510 [Candidatus Sumerlaeaceae bacterium]|nr:hypothetical protein [Candidatus Sumerlaeaceae bacterium]